MAKTFVQLDVRFDLEVQPGTPAEDIEGAAMCILKQVLPIKGHDIALVNARSLGVR